MKYALLVYPDADELARLAEGEQRSVLGEYLALSQQPGVFAAGRLQPRESATTVQVAGGSTLTIDGPFADTKEVVGGLYLLEADDLDVALEFAARIPAARLGGAVEVRPMVER